MSSAVRTAFASPTMATNWSSVSGVGCGNVIFQPGSGFVGWDVDGSRGIICRAPYINYPGGLVKWEVAMLSKIFPVLLSVVMLAGSASAGQLSKVSSQAGLPAFDQ